MGPKKVVSKDDSEIDTTTGKRFDEVCEKLLDAYTETENVKRRNVQLEIQSKELEAAVRERDLEIRYLSEKMDKEVETVVRDRDMVTQRMLEELHAVQGQLAEARQAQANIPSQSNGLRADHFDAREHLSQIKEISMFGYHVRWCTMEKRNMRCLLGRFCPGRYMWMG